MFTLASHKMLYIRNLQVFYYLQCDNPRYCKHDVNVLYYYCFILNIVFLMSCNSFFWLYQKK